MNVNFVKEFGVNKYIIIDPNSEVQLKNVKNCPHSFYIFNTNTNVTNSLTDIQFKKLFSENSKDLEKLLNVIITRNVDIEKEKLLKAFTEITEKTFNDGINDQQFLRFIGEFSSLDEVPNNLQPGNMFEVVDEDLNHKHYIVNKNNEINRIYTEIEIDELFSNIYKNYKIDEKIEELKIQNSQLYIEKTREIDNIKNSLYLYVTFNEMLDIKNKFQNEIFNFKREIESKYNLKLDEECNKIDVAINSKISELTENFNNYRNEILNNLNIFKETVKNDYLEIQTKINELNDVVEDLSGKVLLFENELNNALDK